MKSPMLRLRRDAIYITPLGRRCRLVVTERKSIEPASFSFCYVSDEGSSLGHGFALTPHNLGVLKEVPIRGPAPR